MDKKVLLMILDGWGEGRQDESNVQFIDERLVFLKVVRSTKEHILE